MNQKEEMYSVYKMAKYMNVSASTIYNWISAGLECEKYPYGRKMKVMISMSAMDEFLRKSRMGEI